MAALAPAFFDTSVLLAGLMEIGDASEYPQKLLTAIADGHIRGPVTAWHCCLEFYSVATRLPEEFRLGPTDALRLVEGEILARFDVRQLPDSAGRRFCSSSNTIESPVGGSTTRTSLRSPACPAPRS